MQTLLTFTWEMERGLDLGVITLRYYSLLFAAGFVLGYFLMKRMFKDSQVSLDKLDTLLTYVVIATILGARLGHVFFYEWDYYSSHPAEILKVWKGGLASHGAAIAIIIAVIIYSRRVLDRSSLWMLDRLVITVALAAALIRVGNFFNSEIYGKAGNSQFETVFLQPSYDRIMSSFPFVEKLEFHSENAELITDSIRYPAYRMEMTISPKEMTLVDAQFQVQARIAPYMNGLDRDSRNMFFPKDFSIMHRDDKPGSYYGQVYGVPRYPTQIYEALGYLFIFLILYRLYLLDYLAGKRGFLFGMFLTLVFGFRFFIEFYKEVQVASELGQTLNTGQKLSIPLVLIGLFFSSMALIRPKWTVE